MIRTLLVLSAAASLTANATYALAQAPTTGPAAAQPAPADKPLVLKLLDAGTGEKKPLRYALASGAEATFTATGTVESKATLGGSEMPVNKPSPMTSKTTIKTKEVDSSGDAHVDMTYTGPAANKGASSTAVLTDRGLVKSFELVIPKDEKPAVRQQLESTRRNVTQYFVPLPEEAVGAGAKWRASQTFSQQNITIEQETVYTLVSREGDTLNLKIEITQSAPEQDLQMQGTTVHLKSMTGNGAGEAKVDLNSLLCASTKFNMTTDMAMVLPQVGDMTQHAVTSMTGTTEIKPAEKK